MKTMITNFFDSAQHGSAPMSIAEFKRRTGRHKTQGVTTLTPGSVVARGSFTNLQTTALKGPFVWRPNASAATTFPMAEHVETFTRVYTTTSGVYTGPVKLSELLDSLETTDVAVSHQRCDGFEVVLTDTDFSRTPSPDHSLLAAGATLLLNFTFEPIRASVTRKKSFQVSALLQGTPFTLWIFGVEDINGVQVLRPFTRDENLRMHIPGFDDVTVFVKPIHLTSVPAAGPLRSFFNHLKPRPINKLREDLPIHDATAIDDDGPPLLEQLRLPSP